MIQWKVQYIRESEEESASSHCATDKLCDLGQISNPLGLSISARKMRKGWIR